MDRHLIGQNWNAVKFYLLNLKPDSRKNWKKLPVKNAKLKVTVTQIGSRKTESLIGRNVYSSGQK